MDGVILDWETSFHEWMEAQGHTLIYPGIKGVHSQYSLDPPVAMNMVKAFNQSAAIGFLKPFRDAIENILLLYEQGWNFHFVTALGTDPYAQQLREKNLAYYLKDMPFTIEYVDTAGPKTEILKRIGEADPGALWIEDNPKNAQDGLDAGLNSVIIKHAYNAGYTSNFIAVHEWREIVDYLKGE